MNIKYRVRKGKDIFETLEETGEDFETAAEKLMEYF